MLNTLYDMLTHMKSRTRLTVSVITAVLALTVVLSAQGPWLTPPSTNGKVRIASTAGDALCVGATVTSPTTSGCTGGIYAGDIITTRDVTVGRNLAVTSAGPHGVGAGPNTRFGILIGGTFVASGAGGHDGGVVIGPTLNVQTNATGSTVLLNGTLTKAASGTHPYFATLRAVPPAIAGGGATTTAAATVIIDGAPVGATSNYSLLVLNGLASFGSDVTVGSDLTVGDQLLVTGTGRHAIGTSANTRYGLLMGGTFAPTGGGAHDVGLNVTQTIALQPDTFGSAINVSPIFTEAASGVHAEIASLRLDPPVITNGGATTTQAVTLRVNGAPTGATDNFALAVSSGTSAFSGPVLATTGYREFGRGTGLGQWTDVSYSSGNFSTDSGTWTVESGDQLKYKYMLVGMTMTIAFNLANTSLSGVGNELRIKIPGGFTALDKEYTAMVSAFGTLETPVVCVTMISPNADKISIQRLPVTGWPNSTNAQVIRGTMTFEVAP